MTIELHITRTGKGYAPTGQWQTFDDETLSFENLTKASEYLAETYGNCKRQKMYRDKADGTAEHIGYIYGFRNQDYSHGGEKWLQQDWVSISKVTRESALKGGK